MKIQKKIGILACEDAPGWGGEQGISSYITKQFGRIEDGVATEFVHFHAVTGQLPQEDEIRSFDGFVISGSHYSVNDGHNWIDNLINFVRSLRDLPHRPKLFGICFGHQLIAKALGGKVENNSSKKFVWGTEQIEMAAPLRVNSLLSKAFGERRGHFKIAQSHGEWVSFLPKEAVCIGRSSSCEHEVLMYGETIMSTQGHPELVEEALVGNILPRLRDKGILNAEEENLALQSLSDEDQYKLIQFVKMFLVAN